MNSFVFLLAMNLILSAHAGTLRNPAHENHATKTATTIKDFIQDLSQGGRSSTISAGRAKSLEVPADASTKRYGFIANEVTDGLIRGAELILDPTTEKHTPLCLIFFAGNEDLKKLDKKTYFFRLSLDGVLEKASIQRGKLSADGKPVPGSAVWEPKDINSKEIKDRLKHELNFWLKGMYRKPLDKPASPPQPKDAKMLPPL